MKFTIDGTEINLCPDVAHGSQIIQIQATEFGTVFAQTLGAARLENGSYLVEHTREVDLRIIALVDTLISIRYNHPTYTQLDFGIKGRR
jgi:hypothetical protein